MLGLTLDSGGHEELLLDKYRQVKNLDPPLTVERSRLDRVPVGRPALLLWEGLDEVVDAEDGDGGLRGHLQALGFDHGGLVHAGLAVVSGLAVDEVQANPGTQKPGIQLNECLGLFPLTG